MNSSAAVKPQVEPPATLAAATGDQRQARAADAEFFERYEWCLNPFPTVGETVGHLAREIEQLAAEQPAWQLSETATNVYLFACALANAVDEYLRGPTLRLPKQAPKPPLFRQFQWTAEKLLAVPGARCRSTIRRWRAEWRQALEAYVVCLVAAPLDPADLHEAARKLAALLPESLPQRLTAERIYFPSAYRKHDLTHYDVLSLGRSFADRNPDRRQPLLIVGLRTAGSYFAPVLAAHLRSSGFEAVDALTLRPSRGPSAAVRAKLFRAARDGRRAVLIDDSPRTGDTVAQAVKILRRAGFRDDAIAILVTVHAAMRDWQQHPEAQSLVGVDIIALDAEQWHKRRLVEPEAIEHALADLQCAEWPDAVVVSSEVADAATVRLANTAEEPRRARLKRVFEVRTRTPQGRSETRYVLAKSVGWGWLGYHAILAGRRLERFVPPVLGLRNGILFSQWIENPPDESVKPSPEQLADYIAARVSALALRENPLATLGLHQHHDSLRLLDRVLGRAYGRTLTAQLMRPSIRSRLVRQPSPRPTLIDGKMEPSEWLSAAERPLKSDYEHHGMGKNELNLADPAFDLADAILQHELSLEDEHRLLESYAEQSGDKGVADRLFIHKLLAGIWGTAAALKYLFRRPPLPDRQADFNRRFIAAWHFLTVQTARHCGDFCRPTQPLSWRAPLIALDIDGVLDRRVFAFPSTTAAGVEAVAQLHDHQFAIAVNTARSAVEVREYCSAYGFVGGVAEYGAYVWNAVERSERLLLCAETLRQLATLRDELRRIPGVYLDDRHEYSIRAYTFDQQPAGFGRSRAMHLLGTIKDSPYEGRFPTPLPRLIAAELIARLGLDRLRVHQTSIDTTIVGAECDKGTGLTALLEQTGIAPTDVIAVGDSEPDLPMFRIAGRSLAPANIRCRSAAKSLGCQIVRPSYQNGLLAIARKLTHGGRRHCPQCDARQKQLAAADHLFLDLLRIADRSDWGLMLRAVANPRTYMKIFR